MRRPGGDQIIPRPPVWEPGDPAPWGHLSEPPVIKASALAEAVAALGPGSPPAVPMPESRHAAVLVALFDGPEGAEVVLTRRARHLSTHKGEVSFPGGRMDPGETPAQTALREAWEEILLDPGLVTLAGELDHIATVVSRHVIVPVVGTMESLPELAAGTSEVGRILTVPLVDFLREDTYHEERWGTMPLDRSVYFFELDDETVWGATARILVQLLEVATGVA